MNDELISEGRVESPASRADQAAVVACQQGHDGGDFDPIKDKHDGVRSEVDNRRTATHEASHCVVGRALGQEVAGCSIVPGDTYGGLTWGPSCDFSKLSTSDDDVSDLCKAIGDLMPQAGEPRVDAAEIYAHVHVRVVELMAGTVGELLLHPECTPWTAHSDIQQARARASLICSSETAIDRYLEFGREEAKALILQHRAAVLAIAEALMVHRTLDATMIDNIISHAPERARRADWKHVTESAARFVQREEAA